MSTDLITKMSKLDPEKLNTKLKNKQQQTHECPNCKSKQITVASAEEVCGECGLVLSGPIPYVATEKIDYPYGINLLIFG